MLYRTAGSTRLLVSTLLPLSLLIASLAGPGCSCRGEDPDPDPEADAGPDTGEEIVEYCATSIEPVSSGSCEARGGSGPAVLIRGDVLGADRVYVGGSVLYNGDSIVCVGCDCSGEAGAAEATKIDCPDSIVSPGLINPHDHLSFTEGAPIPTGLNRYDHRHDWRGSLSTPSNPHGTGANSAGMQWGEIRMMVSGVTSMVGSGRANSLVRNLDQLATDETARGFTTARFDTFSLGDSNETFRADCGWNFRLDEREVSELDAYLPHVAEGIDDYALEEFRCQSTSFGGGQDFTEKNASHIHSIGLSGTDYLKMADDGTRMIWSPRSNIALYGHTAQVTLFDTLGGRIALGTDWTYSGSANMTRELACADQLNQNQYAGHFSDRQLFEMATINAAIATGNDTMIGSLEAGKVADIAVYAGTGIDGSGYYRVLFGVDSAATALVIKDGRPMYGETAALGALEAGCEAVDVCGESRSICTQREIGTTFADLAGQVSSGTPAYPVFFCGEPQGEPTCVPFRGGEFDGMPTAEDPDGDGLTGANDNCPDVFNPIRPIDGGAQPDTDSDGLGDACDDTPMPTDIDLDGVTNDADNCPFDANADQADGDSDNKGDTCDFCPSTANPDGVCNEIIEAMPATVPEVQTGTVTEGTMVEITNLVVTGVYSRGAYAQDPTAGSENSGIHLFVGTQPSVSIGDEISVVGVVTEFFEETELDDAEITRIGAGTAIAPVALTAAEAAQEQYEGVLVTVTDAAVTANPHDCANDNPGCSDGDLWEINSAIVVFDRLYGEADWAARMGQVPVTGVMTYRFDRRRLMPRAPTDF